MAYPKGTFYHEGGRQKINNVDIIDGIMSGTLGGVAFKAITVDCTDSYELTVAEQNATVINISKAGASKVLTLGMTAGQRVVITNATANNVTVKNLATDTGVASTANKTADFLITAGEILKITADV